MKFAYIIPGFGETGTEKVYKNLAQIFKNTGYSPVILKINWDRHVMSDYILATKDKLQNKEHLRDIICGFSFGAFIAIHIAQQIQFAKCLSLSCSPYFSETISNFPKEVHQFFGKRRMEDFKKYSLRKIINSKFSTPDIKFFFGENDWKKGIEVSNKLAKKFKKEVTLIKNTAHELTPHYFSIIKSEL